MSNDLLKEVLDYQRGTFELVKKHEKLMELYKVPVQNRPQVAVLVENMKRNAPHLLKEVTTNAEISAIEKNIMPMIMRAMPATVGSEIFGFQPLNADTGVFFHMNQYYTNDSANNIPQAECIYMILGDATAFAVGDPITTDGAGAGVGVVRYKESNRLLVDLTSGTFAVGNNVDDANPYAAADTTISDTGPAILGYRLFSDYSAAASIAAGEALSTDMKELEFGIGKTTVTAISHKIKMRYTHEVINSLRDYQNLDGDMIVSSTGANAFVQELNLKIMNLVKDYGTTGGVETFNYAAADGRWEVEKIQNLVSKINRVSAQILKANKMGGATYVIIDPITHSFLSANKMIDSSMLPGGVAMPERNPFVGILNGIYRVYVNVHESSTVVTMGWKDFSGAADSELRAGAFFCPYLPVQRITTIGEDDGQPRAFFHSFYAFAAHPFAANSGGNDFFRRINISGLPA